MIGRQSGCHDDLVDPLDLACNKSSLCLTAQLTTKQVFLYKYLQFNYKHNERKIHVRYPNGHKTNRHNNTLGLSRPKLYTFAKRMRSAAIVTWQWVCHLVIGILCVLLQTLAWNDRRTRRLGQLSIRNYHVQRSIVTDTCYLLCLSQMAYTFSCQSIECEQDKSSDDLNLIVLISQFQ